METPVIVPELGEAIVLVQIVEWLKQVGDPLEADEPLVEITTEKIDVVLGCPAAGRLLEIRSAPGEKVRVGATIGLIGPR